jgi:threonine dehydrogenase-like Zn-dependent dehydrogenase
MRSRCAINLTRCSACFDASRNALATEFGATDIVTERGDDGVAAVKELTGGLGAHSVIEAVGTQASMMQAIRSARPGGAVG